jgi:flagella basal body P-ring formation protein FlgA
MSLAPTSPVPGQAKPGSRRRLWLVTLASIATWVVLARAALGAEVTLRPDIADADGRVTLGELFEGAGAAGDIAIANRAGPTVVLDAGAVQAAARRAGLDWANAQGIRRIIVRGGAEVRAVSGSHNVEVLTYARSLAAGELVQAGDLIWAKAAAAPADAPRDAEAVVGMSARRPLREGALVSLRDIAPPIVIKAGESVAVTFQEDGITLTLTGKALAAASVGDAVNIQNTASKKIVQAVASGPGQAVVGPAAQALQAARSFPQFASR